MAGGEGEKLMAITSAVCPSESSWEIQHDLPYFDRRSLVETSAEFVAASFQVRTRNLQNEMSNNRSASGSPDGSEGGVGPVTRARREAFREPMLLQAVTCHAHKYLGAERFALELVPRCKPLREQLLQTVRPLCVNTGGAIIKGGSFQSSVEYEVDRFLRARLVVFDLSELLSYDCFAPPGSVPEDVFIAQRPSSQRLLLASANSARAAAVAAAAPFASTTPARINALLDHAASQDILKVEGKHTKEVMGTIIDEATELQEALLEELHNQAISESEEEDESEFSDEEEELSEASVEEKSWMEILNPEPKPYQKPKRGSKASRSSSRERFSPASAGHSLPTSPQARESSGLSSMDAVTQVMASAASAAAAVSSEQHRLELAMRRFELRFWRAFTHGLGRSLFGKDQDSLTCQFEGAAQEVLERYDGELNVAMNSLMSTLPSWLSDSLFIAMVGLLPGSALRLNSKKYSMLHRCVRSLLDSSGRYVFISTPGWYLPMLSRLPPLGVDEAARAAAVFAAAKCAPTLVSGMATTGSWLGGGVQGASKGAESIPAVTLRSMWPPACLDPQRCIEAVDAIWGGRIAGQRAARGFCGAVEAMGRWVLRMSLGMEGLLSPALLHMKEMAPFLEQAYDELLEAGGEGLVAPSNPVLAQSLAETLAEVLARRAAVLKRQGQTSRSSVTTGMPALDQSPMRLVNKRKMSILKESAVPKRLSMMPRGSVQVPPGKSKSVFRGSILTGSIKKVQEEMQRKGRLKQPKMSLLEELLAETKCGLAATHEETKDEKIRTEIAVGGEKWPVGQGPPGTTGGRIPVHDASELTPHSPPPAPGDFTSLLAPAPTTLITQATSLAPLSAMSIAGKRTSVMSAFSGRRRRGLRGMKLEKELVVEKPPLPEMKGGRSDQLPDRGSSEGGPLFQLRRVHTAPELSMPKPFAEQLDAMSRPIRGEEAKAALRRRWGGGGGLAATAASGSLRRTKSALAAVDCNDFDVGDRLRNSAVALALQSMLQSVMGTAAADGPLQAVWRMGRTDEEEAELQRLRINSGILLLLAALRAPLPTLAEIHLHHFVSLATFGLEKPAPVAPQPEREASPPPMMLPPTHRALPGRVKEIVVQKKPPPPPSVRIPEGIFALGCAPIFFTMPTDSTGPTSPMVSGAFHIGVPHVLLEDRVLWDTLVDRSHGAAAKWRSGSLVVMLSAGANIQAHTISNVWTRSSGWIRQAHGSVFTMCCCFRVILGLEFMALWHKSRPTAPETTMEQFFPFLLGSGSEIAGLSAEPDVSAAKGQRPILIAPILLTKKPATPGFDPNFLDWGPEWRINGGVPLADFAAWVGTVGPGRVVYCSHVSAAGHLIFRLEDAVLIIVFKLIGSNNPGCNVDGPELMKIYKDAVGQAQWWGVSLVSLMLLTDQLATELVDLCGVGASNTAGVIKEGQTIPIASEEEESTLIVESGSEIIVCPPNCLGALLGPLRESVFRHHRVFEMEMLEEATGFRAELLLRTELKRRRWQAAGGGRAAAGAWRALRPAAPKGNQLDLNMTMLMSLLQFVEQRLVDLDELLKKISAENGENSALGSRASSPEPWTLDQFRTSVLDTEQESEVRSRSSVSSHRALTPDPQSEEPRSSLLKLPLGDEAQRRGSSWLQMRTEAERLLLSPGHSPVPPSSDRSSPSRAAEDQEESEPAQPEIEVEGWWFAERMNESCGTVSFEKGAHPQERTRPQHWRSPTPHPNRPATAKRKKLGRDDGDREYEFDFIGFDWQQSTLASAVSQAPPQSLLSQRQS